MHIIAERKASLAKHPNGLADWECKPREGVYTAINHIDTKKAAALMLKASCLAQYLINRSLSLAPQAIKAPLSWAIVTALNLCCSCKVNCLRQSRVYRWYLVHAAYVQRPCTAAIEVRRQARQPPTLKSPLKWPAASADRCSSACLDGGRLSC